MLRNESKPAVGVTSPCPEGAGRWLSAGSLSVVTAVATPRWRGGALTEGRVPSAWGKGSLTEGRDPSAWGRVSLTEGRGPSARGRAPLTEGSDPSPRGSALLAEGSDLSAWGRVALTKGRGRSTGPGSSFGPQTALSLPSTGSSPESTGFPPPFSSPVGLLPKGGEQATGRPGPPLSQRD